MTDAMKASPTSSLAAFSPSPTFLLASLPVLLTVTNTWWIFTSIPLWWLWFVAAGLLYPTYLLYIIQPYTTPSLRRTTAILAPLLVLCLLARPARLAEQWHFELAHLVIGAVVFAFKKAPEFAVGRVEQSVVDKWGHFIAHYLMPGDVAFEEEYAVWKQRVEAAEQQHQLSGKAGKPDYRNIVLPPHLTAEQYHAHFHNVRQRALRHLMWATLHSAIGSLFALLTLYLHTHHPWLLEWRLVADGCACGMIVTSCCFMFHVVPAVAELLYGDGIHIGVMWDRVIVSVTISEFWRRWNRGMRDVVGSAAHTRTPKAAILAEHSHSTCCPCVCVWLSQFFHCVYKPLGGRQNYIISGLLVGLFSGCPHEYEVWINIGHTRFGMLRYFMLQVLGVMVERLWAGGRPAWCAMPVWCSRLLTAVWLLVTSHWFILDFGLELPVMARKALNIWMVPVAIDFADVLRWIGTSPLEIVRLTTV